MRTNGYTAVVLQRRLQQPPPVPAAASVNPSTTATGVFSLVELGFQTLPADEHIPRLVLGGDLGNKISLGGGLGVLSQRRAEELRADDVQVCWHHHHHHRAVGCCLSDFILMLPQAPVLLPVQPNPPLPGPDYNVQLANQQRARHPRVCCCLILLRMHDCS